MVRPEIPPEEAAAALGSRRELGAEMEPAVVAAFVERVEREIDARVDARLAERGGRGAQPGQRFMPALPIASLGVAIPLTAIAGGIGGVVAILIVWIGIVAVNVAHARGQGAPTRARR